MKKTLLSLIGGSVFALGILGFAGLGVYSHSAVENDRPIEHPIQPPV